MSAIALSFREHHAVKRQGRAESGLRWLDCALLALILLVGAFLAAGARSVPSASWLGIVSLFPLFVAIRVTPPRAAFVGGLLWSAAAWVLSHLWGDPASDGLLAASLFILLPATYAALGAALTRWIGFSPFVLSVAWVFVEWALAPQPQVGVTADRFASYWLFAAIGKTLGYVFVGMVAAYVCAAIVEVIDRIPVATASSSLVRVGGGGTTFANIEHRTCLLSQWSFPSGRPRAPPLGLI